jgi:hypothetical protein
MNNNISRHVPRSAQQITPVAFIVTHALQLARGSVLLRSVHGQSRTVRDLVIVDLAAGGQVLEKTGSDPVVSGGK